MADEDKGLSEAAQRKAAKAAEKSSFGADEVQKRVDEEQDQGFRGEKADPTPNEHYTVAGVTSGKPTPETDPEKAGGRR